MKTTQKTIQITVGAVLPKTDPSGGPGAQVEVSLPPGDDPLQVDGTSEFTFEFAGGGSRVFTGFRYIRCGEDALSYKYLGTWYSAKGLDNNWQAGDVIAGTIASDGSSMVITDTPTGHTETWNYLYLVEWTEDGQTFVCDPKIKQGPPGT